MLLMLLSLLIPFAILALFSRDNLRSVILWCVFASIMVPVWVLLGMPWVALAQGMMGLAVTSGFIWCSLHQTES